MIRQICVCVCNLKNSIKSSPIILSVIGDSLFDTPGSGGKQCTAYMKLSQRLGMLLTLSTARGSQCLKPDLLYFTFSLQSATIIVCLMTAITCNFNLYIYFI